MIKASGLRFIRVSDFRCTDARSKPRAFGRVTAPFGTWRRITSVKRLGTCWLDGLPSVLIGQRSYLLSILHHGDWDAHCDLGVPCCQQNYNHSYSQKRRSLAGPKLAEVKGAPYALSATDTSPNWAQVIRTRSLLWLRVPSSIESTWVLLAETSQNPAKLFGDLDGDLDSSWKSSGDAG